MLEIFTLFALYFLLQWVHATPLQTVVVFFVWLIFSLPGVLMVLRGSPPLIPTAPWMMRIMMNFADIKPGEKVYDVGCGDGRLVFAAAGVGANAVGYELSIFAFMLAWFRSLFHKGATIRFGDFWKKDVSDADVIFCYLLIGAMADFKETIWTKLKPGTRVVSHSFRMTGIIPVKEERGVFLYVK